MEYISHYKSPLGKITMAAEKNALTGLWFDGQKYYADTLGAAWEKKELPVFEQTKKWLDIYFGGKNPDFMPPLAMKTTPFRKEVWEILLTIPYGKTMTYGEIAKQISSQRQIQDMQKNAGENGGRNEKVHMSAQAVGQAVGHNSISILIPCHRVVGSDGSLTGYAGGIEKKVQLLTLEKVDMSHFYVPKKGTAL